MMSAAGLELLLTSEAVNRQDATQIIRAAAGLDAPDLGEVLQNAESGFIFSPPNRLKVRTLVDGDYVSLRDAVILCDATSADVTVNLPSAAKAVWKIYIVKKVDSSANNVIVSPSGSETIDGSAPLSFSTALDFKRIVSDGSNWWTV